MLGKVIEEEKIDVNDSDIDAEIEKIVNNDAENKSTLQNFLDTPQSRQSMKQTLIARKTIDYLIDIAKGQEKLKTEDKEETK